MHRVFARPPGPRATSSRPVPPRFFPLLLLSLAAPVAAKEKGGPPSYPPDLRIEADVAYLPTDRNEKLDIYHPPGAGAGTPLPAVIFYHGGGFNDGDKAKDREVRICSDLARAGFVAVSVNYKLRRMQGQVTWPRNIHDCKLALQWVRANAVRLGIDPDRIAVMGGSAGGTIAALLAYSDPDDGLEPPEGNPAMSGPVACIVDLYGPMDLMTYRDMKMFAKTREEAPDLYRQASPLTYLDKSDPPTFVTHGTSDETVNIGQSEKLVAKLKELGIAHEYVVVPQAPHSYDLRPLQMDLKPAVLGFLKKHLVDAPPAKP